MINQRKLWKWNFSRQYFFFGKGKLSFRLSRKIFETDDRWIAKQGVRQNRNEKYLNMLTEWLKYLLYKQVFSISELLSSSNA